MPIDPALTTTLLAANSLTQLNRISKYTRMGITNYEAGNFERNQSITIRRPKKRAAQNVDTRGAGLTFSEGEFIAGEVILQRLWGDGIPVFHDDPGWSIDQYVLDSSAQMARAIATANDDYVYSKFRDWTDIPATGTVNLGVHPPTLIVSEEDGTGSYGDFTNDVLRSARGGMKDNDVPFELGDIYAGISNTAETAFIGDQLTTAGFTPAVMPGQSGGVSVLRSGIPDGEFIERWGFYVTGSNAVTGQTAIADVDGTNPTAAIAAVADDTTVFFDGEETTSTPAGAVNITFTAGTIGGTVAVGQIARIGPAAGTAVAHGIILRIDTTGANPIVTLVPYSPKGKKIVAAQITAGTDVLSVPEIGSVNTANHKEGLLCATRNTKVPSSGAGVLHKMVSDARTGLSLQVYMGNFQVGFLKEENAYYNLTGAKFSDYRKGALMLTA